MPGRRSPSVETNECVRTCSLPSLSMDAPTHYLVEQGCPGKSQQLDGVSGRDRMESNGRDKKGDRSRRRNNGCSAVHMWERMAGQEPANESNYDLEHKPWINKVEKCALSMNGMRMI